MFCFAFFQPDPEGFDMPGIGRFPGPRPCDLGHATGLSPQDVIVLGDQRGDIASAVMDIRLPLEVGFQKRDLFFQHRDLLCTHLVSMRRRPVQSEVLYGRHRLERPVQDTAVFKGQFRIGAHFLGLEGNKLQLLVPKGFCLFGIRVLCFAILESQTV